MQAIILAGGHGKRLKPITDFVPKPLVPINNIPIIEWQINYLKKFGIKDVIICTGYKTEQIENYLKAKKNFKIKIKISIEKTPLGTGGAIKKAGKFITGKSFYVLNGDTITNLDLRKLAKKQNSIAAIELQTKFGTVDVKEDKIIKFNEKKPISNVWMNAGAYLLSKNMIKDLPKKGDIEKTTFPKYAKKEKLHLIKYKGVKWFSIDSHKDIEECSKDINKIIKK